MDLYYILHNKILHLTSTQMNIMNHLYTKIEAVNVEYHQAGKPYKHYQGISALYIF